MIIVSMDGAIRRPNKPNSLALGLAVAVHGEDIMLNSAVEHFVTSQRGELHGLDRALDKILYLHRNFGEDEFYLITDSEYLYNAITKEWYRNWPRKNWLTADGNPIKNRDMWESITGLMDMINGLGIEISLYHTVGHVVSVGKATAKKLIESDDSYRSLLEFIQRKFVMDTIKKPHELVRAKEVFEKNHGFLPPEEVHKQIIIYNTLTDVIAGYLIDKEDAAQNR